MRFGKRSVLKQGKAKGKNIEQGRENQRNRNDYKKEHKHSSPIPYCEKQIRSRSKAKTCWGKNGMMKGRVRHFSALANTPQS
jgi:hypothetical protein